MKKTLLLTFLFPIMAFSQSVTPEVVSNGGDHFVGGSSQLSWTLGEIAINTYSGTSNQLTQGFHQPDRGTVSIDEFADNIIVNAYPNPFKSSVNVAIPDSDEPFQISVFNAVGQLILSDSHTGSGPKTLDFEELAKGIYLIEFKSQSQILKTIKVQKL
ncbi:MAG: hypothetical protein ACI857_001735 [Arenicella sp.]|jgi:hypothetical protein